jgi:hypothetical protein
MWASANGHSETMKMLLADSRVDANMGNKVKLIQWINRQWLTGVVCIFSHLHHFFFVLLYVQRELTALMLASICGHTEIIKSILVDPKVNVNAQRKVWSGSKYCSNLSIASISMECIYT